MTAPDPSAWGGVEVLGRLMGGARNSVFAARRGDERFVLRTSQRPLEALEWELDLLDTLRGAGVAVPHTIPTDDGHRHHRGLLLQRWVTGHAPRDRRDWLRVVQAVATAHEVTGGWPQRPGFASAHDLLRRDAGGDIDLSSMPPDAAAQIREAWRPLAGQAEGAIHGDLGDGNALVNDRVVTLIDWDESRSDALALDFAHLPADLPIPVAIDRDALITAGIAWEAATCWIVEPAYAARRLVELRGRL